MNFPNHQMIWVWIAGTAALTPLGLVVLRKLYKDAEDRAMKAAEEAAAEAAKEAAENASA